MNLPVFEFAEAESIVEACQCLERQGEEAQVIAGGTDLLTLMKSRLKAPKLLVDINGIPGLDKISYSAPGGLKVGALVSLRRLAADALVREKYPILVQAALSVGSPQLRAMGTIGGNLCQDNICLYFDPSAAVRQSLEPCHKLGGAVCYVVQGSKECWATYAGDVAPALLVLGAKVKVVDSSGEKMIPLSELYSCDGKRPHTLHPGQLITQIQVPVPSPHSGGAYLKLRQRETLEYPLLGVAVHLTMEGEEGICKKASLALTAVDKAPVEVKEADKLKGKKLTNDVIQELAKAAYKRAHPMKNLCGFTVSYRLKMVNAFVDSAIQQALRSATN